MRANSNSIFFALLAIAHFFSNNCSLADEIVNPQSSEPSSAGDILHKQRLDEIRALTEMKNKAAADRDSRGKITSLIRENAENSAAESADLVARVKSALKAANGLYHEKATEQAGKEYHGTPIAESAAGTDSGAVFAKDIDLDTRSFTEMTTVESKSPDSVSSALNGLFESIEHAIQERIIPLVKEVVESNDVKPAEAVPDVVAEKFIDLLSNVEGSAAVADAAINVAINKVTPDADKVTLDADKVTLDADKVVPDADKVTLDADKAPLDADKVTLDADKATPDADKVTPDADKVTPDADKATLDADKATPDADKVTLDATLSDISVEQTVFDTSNTISAMLDSVLPEHHESSGHVMQKSGQEEKITPVIDQIKEPKEPILQPIQPSSAKPDTSSVVEIIQTLPIKTDDVVVVDKTILELINTKRDERDTEEIIDDSSEDDAMKEVSFLN